jgi:hypothetical protein
MDSNVGRGKARTARSDQGRSISVVESGSGGFAGRAADGFQLANQRVAPTDHFVEIFQFGGFLAGVAKILFTLQPNQQELVAVGDPRQMLLRAVQRLGQLRRSCAESRIRRANSPC